MSENKTPEMELAEMKAALEAANQRIAKMETDQLASMHCKVGEKGGVVVSGLGRFPVTLYKEQMIRFLDYGPTIRQFIKDNDSKLSVKVRKVSPTANGAVKEFTAEEIAALNS